VKNAERCRKFAVWNDLQKRRVRTAETGVENEDDDDEFTYLPQLSVYV